MLDIQDYATDISLFEPFIPVSDVLSENDKGNIVDALLEEMTPVMNRMRLFDARTNSEKRKLLQAAINGLDPFFFSRESIQKLDLLLQTELHAQALANGNDLAQSAAMEIEGTKIILWQGDISAIKVDAIVNAANNRLLGCFQPLHKCIDNVIHSKAGVQLRDDCFRIMQKQNMPEPTGFAKITRAYNLPSPFVIHTVGPKVQGELRRQHKEALQRSYLSCLNITKAMRQIKSIAFCCISTGVFGFPHEQAAQTAFNTVCGWLNENAGELAYLVFNVFSDRDRLAYESLIGKT